MFHVVQRESHEVSLSVPLSPSSASQFTTFFFDVDSSSPAQAVAIWSKTHPRLCHPHPRMLPVRVITGVQPHYQCLPIPPPCSPSPSEHLVDRLHHDTFFISAAPLHRSPGSNSDSTLSPLRNICQESAVISMSRCWRESIRTKSTGS